MVRQPSGAQLDNEVEGQTCGATGVLILVGQHRSTAKCTSLACSNQGSS